MTTSTFSHAGTEHASSHAIQATRAFLIAWFRATPAYLVYRMLAH